MKAQDSARRQSTPMAEYTWNRRFYLASNSVSTGSIIETDDIKLVLYKFRERSYLPLRIGDPVCQGEREDCVSMLSCSNFWRDIPTIRNVGALKNRLKLKNAWWRPRL